MTEPRHLTVQANGLSFGALQWGADDAPLALLVHGYPDTAWTWRHLGPFLAERGWRAVAPFTRGYAPTELAPDDRYLVTDLVDDALALHTALGGDERAVLVGHDWGALVTWGVAERAPDRFAVLFALAVPPTRAILKPFTSLRTLRIGLRQARMSWYMLYNQLPATERTLPRLIPRLWRTWSPSYDGTLDAERTLAALHTPARRRAALRYYRNNLQRGLQATFTQTPTAPVHYLHGAQDGCMQSALGTLYPHLHPAGGSIDVVPGTGHFLQLENPALVNSLIAARLPALTEATPADLHRTMPLGALTVEAL